MSRFVIDNLQTVSGGPFSFSVAAGECVALSGPSGCGKTLLLRALADLDPAEGTVALDGTERMEMAASAWRRQVGWLSAEAAWWFDVVGDHFRDQRSEVRGQKLSSIGNGDALAPRSAVPQRSCLEKLGFGEDVLTWRVERLSTGEKQRLGLFRLLLNEPKVLLLDEPTAALDPVNVGLVETVISDYRSAVDAAVVWVSHNPEQMDRVADRHLKLWGDA